MRHASVTFDPAAAACDMPALLSTQRPRHATCQGVCGRRRIWPGASGTPAKFTGESGTPAKFGRILEGPPTGRVGAYRIRPPNIPQGMNVPPRYVHSVRALLRSFGPFRVRLVGVCDTPLHRVRGRGRAFLRSDRNKCTSSSCFCLRILVRLRGQRSIRKTCVSIRKTCVSIRKTCVSIRNITYFIPPVRMAGMLILQAPYLLPISAVCFPRCSRNPRAVNNPSRRN